MKSIEGEDDSRPFYFLDRYVVQTSCEGECSDQNLLPPLNAGWGTEFFLKVPSSQVWRQMKESGEDAILWFDNIPVNGPVSGTALGAIVVQPRVCTTSKNTTFLTTSACVI